MNDERGDWGGGFIQNHNPYMPPADFELDESADEWVLLSEPKCLPAKNGLTWITQAWQIFCARPVFWVALSVLYLVLTLIFTVLPALSMLAGLLHIFLLAGGVYVAYLVDLGEEVSLSDLFIGFRQNTLSLLLLFFLLIGATLAIVVPMLIVVSFIGMTLPQMGRAGLLSIIYIVAFTILMMAPIAMAMFFSPILVLFHDIKPIVAMKLSFQACLRNIAPFLVYFLLMMAGGLIVTALTFGLAYFVLLPIGLIAIYVMYQQILLG